MQKLSSSDKKHLKKLFDQRLASLDKYYKNRETTPTDFDDDGAIPGFALQKFREVTGGSISGSTLERILGLQGGASKPQRGTLIQLLKFLNIKTPEDLYAYLNKQRKRVKKKTEQPFSLKVLFEKHDLRIVFDSTGSITIKRYMNDVFIIVVSQNTKFQKKDIITISQLSIDQELLCSDVKRLQDDNQYMDLGGYHSGHYVLKIELLKPGVT